MCSFWLSMQSLIFHPICPNAFTKNFIWGPSPLNSLPLRTATEVQQETWLDQRFDGFVLVTCTRIAGTWVVRVLDRCVQLQCLSRDLYIGGLYVGLQLSLVVGYIQHRRGSFALDGVAGSSSWDAQTDGQVSTPDCAHLARPLDRYVARCPCGTIRPITGLARPGPVRSRAVSVRTVSMMSSLMSSHDQFVPFSARLRHNVWFQSAGHPSHHWPHSAYHNRRVISVVTADTLLFAETGDEIFSENN